MSDKELKLKEQELAKANEMIFEDAGAGLEEVKQDDCYIPRLAILQTTSPQAQEKNPAYINGAKAGMIVNTVTSEIYDGSVGLKIIPIYYKLEHIEWGLREKGGGFVATHGADRSILDTCVKDDKGRMINKDGNQISATAEYFAFLYNEETMAISPVVISMASSQLKVARKWNTMMKTLMAKGKDGAPFNPAAFYQCYVLNTVYITKDTNSWYGWSVNTYKPTIELPNGINTYIAARDLKNAIVGGKVSAAKPEVDLGTSVDNENDPI